MVFDCQVRQKKGDFFFAHLIGVALVMKENETANPIDVSLFGPNAVVFDPQMPADAVEKLAWW